MKRLLVLLMFAATVCAQKDPTSRSWNQPVKPFRIVGNVYYVGATDITSYLITTPKGHFLLDGGFEETAPMIRANIEKLGFKVSDVQYILSSHAHYDHAGGIAELKRITHAKFVSSEGDRAQHARGGKDDPNFGDRFLYPPIIADRIIKDSESITLGGVTMTAHITAGHTPGCTTWTTKADGHDVIFVGSPTIPNGYKLVGNEKYPTIANDYRRQFRTLRSLHPDVFLASHGNFFDLQAKIASRNFVDPEGYRKFVEEMEARFEKVLAEQERLR
jgi:metallo-beta-lactamase class B